MPYAPSERIREEVLQFVLDGSKSQLALSWHLGEIYGKELWLKWSKPDGTPFKSFADYLTTDLKHHVSRSHGFALAKVGMQFREAKKQLDELITNREVGIGRLIKLSSLVEQGMTDVTHVIRAIEAHETLPEEARQSKDPEAYETLSFMVKRGDAEIIRHGLRLHAIRNGLRTIDESVADIGITEAQDPALPPVITNSSHAAEFIERINEGKYVCEFCGRIPTTPNIHHDIPQSLAQGEGPTSLLCEPCHIVEVQPHWRKFAEKKHGIKKVADMLLTFKTRGSNQQSTNSSQAELSA